MKTIFDPNYRRLISWLVSERKNKGITQPQLAVILGFPSQSYISKIETFERKIDVVEYVQICDVLSIDAKHGLDILSKK